MPFDPSKFRARLASEQKWYRIENLTGGEADVMLYGEIGWLGTTADEFVREVKSLSASQINLHLSSPGGSVFDGIAIMNALRAHPANVTVYVDSLAASIASVIAMAGDRIVARQGSEFMVHEASGLCVGNASDLRELAELLDRQSEKIALIYSARTGSTVEEWRAAMAKETWYSAQEAVDAGLADEIDEPTKETRSAPDEMAVAASWDLSVFRYAGREHAPAPVAVAVAQPERPKPAPPAAAQALMDAGLDPQDVARAVLTEDIRSLIGDEVAAQLRACVEPAADPAPESTPEPDAATPAEPDAVETTDTAADSEPTTEAAAVRPAEDEPQLAPPTAEPEPPAETAPEPVAPVEAEPNPVTPAAEPAPPDDGPTAWAAAVAHLTTPKPNPWAAAFAHLVTPQPSSSAATAA